MSCRCDKVIYNSRRHAKRSIRRQQRRGLHVYRCRAGYWHIGHMPQRVRNGDIDKDAWIEAISPKRRRRPSEISDDDPAPFTPTDMARLVGRREESA